MVQRMKPLPASFFGRFICLGWARRDLKMRNHDVNSNSQLVYSTDMGSICPSCQKTRTKCECRKKSRKLHGDGIIRIEKSTKGRKGKTVTLISGILENEQTLLDLAKSLKQHCGSGGSVKDGIILIQGKHCNKIKVYLEEKGYHIKI